MHSLRVQHHVPQPQGVSHWSKVCTLFQPGHEKALWSLRGEHSFLATTVVWITGHNNSEAASVLSLRGDGGWTWSVCALITAFCSVSVCTGETFSGFTVWISSFPQAVFFFFLENLRFFSQPPTIHLNLLLILWVTITQGSSSSLCCRSVWTATSLTASVNIF